MRIDKFAAEQTGISRSEAKELIKRRLILVGGTPVTSCDVHIDPERDEVTVCGKPVLYISQSVAKSVIKALSPS